MDTPGPMRPPVVDTSCICTNPSIKNISGVKKYVPRTNMCLQPGVKSSIHPVGPKPSRGDRNRNHSPLLPGLPDDLAVACLTRVPRFDHYKLRFVCKRWKRLLTSSFYYTLRNDKGLAEEWIYIMKRDKEKKVSWQAFDPVHLVWQPLPPVPKEYTRAIGFGCAVLGGCHLYLFGGKDPVKGSMRRVVFFSARTNNWHRAPDMKRRRHFLGSCVIDNRLYVAGGESGGNPQTMRSAEVYDPSKNRWEYISDMTAPMVPFIGVVYDGKWFLKGIGTEQQVWSEMYKPKMNRWFPVNNSMVAGWRNPSATLNGKLYALDCKDGCKLGVYDEGSDSWSTCMDSGMHLGNSQALEAAALIPVNGKLCIVRNNMSITVIDVSKAGNSENVIDEDLWETIAGKGHFKTIIRNLLSSLAGRTRLQSHIVHCQVMRA